MKRNAFYAQSGGVTSVINATAASVILEAKKHKEIGKVYAGKYGILGALREELFDTSKESISALNSLFYRPGGIFGSCRFKLKDIDTDRKEYLRLIEVFKAHNIGYFFYNGGNDSATNLFFEFLIPSDATITQKPFFFTTSFTLFKNFFSSNIISGRRMI